MLKKETAICALLSLIPPSGLLAASPTPVAANWVKVRLLPARTIYVDTGSILVRGNSREVWEKTVENVTDPKRVSVEISRWRYDCAKRRDMMLYSEAYLKSGALVDSGGIPKSQRIWDDVRPASTAEALLKFACSR